MLKKNIPYEQDMSYSNFEHLYHNDLTLVVFRAIESEIVLEFP